MIPEEIIKECNIKIVKRGRKRILYFNDQPIAMIEIDENLLWYVCDPNTGRRTMLIEPGNINQRSIPRYSLWNYAIYELMVSTPYEEELPNSPYSDQSK